MKWLSKYYFVGCINLYVIFCALICDQVILLKTQLNRGLNLHGPVTVYQDLLRIFGSICRHFDANLLIFGPILTPKYGRGPENL